MRALAAGDAQRVHDGLSSLGYLPDPGRSIPDALLEHLGDRRRVDGRARASAGSTASTSAEILELGYPPRSPHFASMRRLRMPPPTLLLRRMELQVLALLGELHAGADWGAITAEHHSDAARLDRPRARGSRVLATACAPVSAASSWISAQTTATSVVLPREHSLTAPRSAS